MSMNTAIIQELTDLRTKADELRRLADELERRVKADAPPALPPQWKHAEDPPKRRPIRKGEYGVDEDGEDATRWERDGDIPYWPIVPAQPRPANYTDRNGRKWQAGEWVDRADGKGDYFCSGANFVYNGDCSPNRKEFNGWRWQAIPVPPATKAVRRWNGIYRLNSLHGIEVPLIEDNPAEWPRLDRDTIAREWLTANPEARSLVAQLRWKLDHPDNDGDITLANSTAVMLLELLEATP